MVASFYTDDKFSSKIYIIEEHSWYNLILQNIPLTDNKLKIIHDEKCGYRQSGFYHDSQYLEDLKEGLKLF